MKFDEFLESIRKPVPENTIYVFVSTSFPTIAGRKMVAFLSGDYKTNILIRRRVLQSTNLITLFGTNDKTSLCRSIRSFIIGGHLPMYNVKVVTLTVRKELVSSLYQPGRYLSETFITG